LEETTLPDQDGLELRSTDVIEEQETQEDTTPDGLAFEESEDPTVAFDDIGLREIIGDHTGKTFEEITKSLQELEKGGEITKVPEEDPELSTRQEEILRLKEEIAKLYEEADSLPADRFTEFDSFEDKERARAIAEKKDLSLKGIGPRDFSDKEKSKEKNSPWFSKVTRWFKKSPEKLQKQNRRVIADFMDLKNQSGEPEVKESDNSLDRAA
jgi:hypothetical protein